METASHDNVPLTQTAWVVDTSARTGRLATLIGKERSGCTHAVAKSYNDYVVYETCRGQHTVHHYKHSQRACTAIRLHKTTQTQVNNGYKHSLLL